MGKPRIWACLVVRPLTRARAAEGSGLQVPLHQHQHLFLLQAELGFEPLEPLATFNRRQLQHSFEEPRIYALVFFRRGKEEWERYFFFDAKWSTPTGYLLNLSLFSR